MASVAAAERQRCPIEAGQCGAISSFMRGRNSLGTAPVRRPKKSLICVEAMRIAMPLVNPMTTGRGMKRTAEPRPVSPMSQQDDAGHERDHGKAAHAEAGDDAGDDDDERAGGSADLGARAAQGGDEKSGDDGGVKAGLRRDARGDAEGHGKRQSDQAHGDAGKQVVQEHLLAVLAQSQNRLGQIRITDGH